jgi:hypothetical protein
MLIPNIICVTVLFVVFLIGIITILIIISNRESIKNALFTKCQIKISDDFVNFNPFDIPNNYSTYISSGCLNFIGKIYNNDMSNIRYMERKLSIYNSYDSHTPFIQIWKHKSNNIVFICFRGTSYNTYLEWYNNIKSSQIAINECNYENKPGILKQNNVKIHKGFVNLYNMIWPSILEFVKTLQKECKICVCGHSMGGSMASIISYDIKDYVDNIYVYVYGTPRIGNLQFCQELTKKIPYIYRIVNKDDTFTETPPSVYPNFRRPKHPYVYSHCGIAIPFKLNLGTVEGNHCLSTYMKYC